MCARVDTLHRDVTCVSHNALICALMQVLHAGVSEAHEHETSTDRPTWLATDDGRKWKNTPEEQNWVSRTQIAQISTETKDKEELDVTSHEDEEVTEQV